MKQEEVLPRAGPGVGEEDKERTQGRLWSPGVGEPGEVGSHVWASEHTDTIVRIAHIPGRVAHPDAGSGGGETRVLGPPPSSST